GRCSRTEAKASFSHTDNRFWYSSCHWNSFDSDILASRNRPNLQDNPFFIGGELDILQQTSFRYRYNRLLSIVIEGLLVKAIMISSIRQNKNALTIRTPDANGVLAPFLNGKNS